MTDWQLQFDIFIDTLPQRVGETPREVLRDFIQSLLDQQKKELLEKIRLLPQSLLVPQPPLEEYLRGYNQAVTDLEELKRSISAS